MFTGWSNGGLLAAGGTNFPGKRIWEGGKKVWYDRIYVFDPANARWSVAERPSARAAPRRSVAAIERSSGRSSG